MAESATTTGNGLKVIHASLFRMGTLSMATAYAQLGYKVHHVVMGLRSDTEWNKVDEATEATWPTPKSKTRRAPFTRADWDAFWWSQYDIVTDIASPFVPELIKAYPEAKVVIVQRDFDAWWKSFTNLRDRLCDPSYVMANFMASTFLGTGPGFVSRKLICRFFGVGSLKEVNEARARQVYEEFFRQIRELVPPERRLEYRLGNGWEPLCSFLGAEVPDVPFPRDNDTAALNSLMSSVAIQDIRDSLKVICESTAGRILGGIVGLLVCRWLLGSLG
ncbi:hypothetical protein F4861DRAFT_492279 [Xylaria intraflava]|nr:hypothetical protein F4861DRAFT_492279 [Xylaria intraflava]